MKTLIERLAHLYKMIPSLEGEKGQTGLVRASKASKSTVNQWLSGGIKSMDIKYALPIEHELGVSHIWLMTGDGEFMAPEERQTPVESSQQNTTSTALKLVCETAAELRMLCVYRLAAKDGRAVIDIAVDGVMASIDTEIFSNQR